MQRASNVITVFPISLTEQLTQLIWGLAGHTPCCQKTGAQSRFASVTSGRKMSQYSNAHVLIKIHIYVQSDHKNS